MVMSNAEQQDLPLAQSGNVRYKIVPTTVSSYPLSRILVSDSGASVATRDQQVLRLSFWRSNGQNDLPPVFSGATCEVPPFFEPTFASKCVRHSFRAFGYAFFSSRLGWHCLPLLFHQIPLLQNSVKFHPRVFQTLLRYLGLENLLLNSYRLFLRCCTIPHLSPIKGRTCVSCWKHLVDLFNTSWPLSA